MYEYGGIWADLDVELLKPLDGQVLNNSCIIAQEPLVNSVLMFDNKNSTIPFASNKFMACTPKHPFFKYAIQV